MAQTTEKSAGKKHRLTIQEALSLAEMFGKGVVEAIMSTPLDEVADRLREAAQVSSRPKTYTVDRQGVVCTVE